MLLLLASWIGLAAAAERAAPGAALFESDSLPRFRIVIASNDLGLLTRGSSAYVPADVAVNGQTFRRVGVRLKGNGSFQPVEGKPSLALKFDENVPGQRLLGLSKILLNNASQDSTLMSEHLASALFNAANVPAARVGHARVELNGRDLGFYVLVEAMNKTFLRQHFANPNGNLYEGYARDITGPLEQDSGKPSTQEDVRQLVTIATLPRSERAGLLPGILDIDRFLSFLAISMMGAQHDSYPLNRNNYRLYNDPATGRFVMMPHGIDGSFARRHLSIVPSSRFILSRAVLATPEQERAYRERVSVLFTNVFMLEFMTNHVLAAARRLASAARDEPERTRLKTQTAAFLRRIVARHDAVARQLAGEELVALAVGKDTPVGNTGWAEELIRGDAEFRRVDLAGSPSLRIRTGDAASSASWRRTVLLAPGAYRFLGRARVSNPTGTSGSGATLRISGQPARRIVLRADNWQPIEHAFTVRDDTTDVELICEARGLGVEAWFDLESLRLTRE